MGQKKNRILRFAVTGALLIGTPAMACGGGSSEAHSNEPQPEPMTNEPMAEDTAGDDMGDDGVEPVEDEPMVNEVEPEPEPE